MRLTCTQLFAAAHVAIVASGVLTAGLDGGSSGYFDDGELEVAAERVLDAVPDAPRSARTAAEWQALRDAARQARAEACRENSPGPIAAVRCNVTVIDTRVTPGAPVAPVDPITISDLAAFRPLVGELIVEPDGWGVRRHSRVYNRHVATRGCDWPRRVLSAGFSASLSCCVAQSLPLRGRACTWWSARRSIEYALSSYLEFAVVEVATTSTVKPGGQNARGDNRDMSGREELGASQAHGSASGEPA